MELVVPRRCYDAYLGMPRMSQVKRQLDMDIPRSEIIGPDGERMRSSEAIFNATPHARFCTQAVCAPILEWFMHSGLFAREVPTGRHPLVVNIHSGGGVVACKRLLVGTTLVEIGAFVTHDTAVLSSNPVDTAPVRGLRSRIVRRRTLPRGRRGDDDGGRSSTAGTSVAKSVPDKYDEGCEEK